MFWPRGWSIISSSPSKTFLVFCLAFIFGVALASKLFDDKIRLNYLYILIIVVLFLISYFWFVNHLRLLLGIILLFLFGIVFLIGAMLDYKQTNHIYTYNEEKIVIKAKIVSEPVRKISQTEYVLGNLEIDKLIKGKLILNLPLYPELNYGDTISLVCRIGIPKNYSHGFRYDRYLAMRKIDAICYQPEIINHHSANQTDLLGWIIKFKNNIREKVYLLWPEPNSSFMAGIVYGERSGFPEKLKEDFNRVGLTHIVAVSGYNVSVVSGFILMLLISLGLYRKSALIISLIGIVIFVVFVGASASAVRAGVMGIIILIGQYLGRPSSAGPSLLIAATVMILFNPLILFWDAGFQLSCLATAGIIFTPQIKNIWLEPAKTTLAATIFTLPLILYQFGRVSLVSLPINIVVVWLIPWLMLLGFLAVIFSFIIFSFGVILAYPADLGLSYIIYLAESVSQLRYASVELSIKPWLVIIIYVMIFLIYYKYVKEKNKNSDFICRI